jgi:cytoskeletal protein CcmA (bactofilin family)
MLFRQNGRADQPVHGSAPVPPAGTPPAARPAPAAASPQPAPRAERGNVLIVGEGIRLKGEITACDLLVVEGHVEVSLNETRAVEIKPSGRFIGSCEVEEAEISGVYEGELTVRERLTVRATGQATGKIAYGELELERGGRIAGNLSTRETPRALAAKMTEALQARKSEAPAPGQKVA